MRGALALGIAAVFLMSGVSAPAGERLAEAHALGMSGSAGVMMAISTHHSATRPAGALPTPIRHVVLIMMENEGVDQVYGNLTYATKLANSYGWGGDAVSSPAGTGYYALCHPSAPNYLGITSGQTLQCGTDNYNNYSVNNVGNLLQTAGESWIAYAESATTSCQTANTGAYLVQHNPFVYYGDLGGSGANSTCETHDLPIADLLSDYPFTATPPAFTFITPNDTDDGHSSSAKFGDAWLSKFVPKLQAEPWYSSTAILIAYDESYGSNPNGGYDGLAGGPVFMVAVSPYTEGTGALGYNASHYNTLSTVEWLLGLPPTGTGNDSTTGFPPMKGLFQFPPGPPPTYLVNGAVADSSGGSVAGAKIYANNSTSSNSTVSGPSGGFSIRLPNGSFQLTAVAVGYRPGTVVERVAGANITGVDLQLESIGPPPIYPILGIVTNSTGVGVGGAIVDANNSTSSSATSTGSDGSFSFLLSNGSYDLTAWALGYRPASLVQTVAGAGVPGLVLELQSTHPAPALTFTVNFTEHGLTTGANWSVTFGTITRTSNDSNVSFVEPNGTYDYTVGPMPGEVATPPSGSVEVAGTAVDQGISFSSMSTATTSAGGGAPTWEYALAAVIGVGITVLVAVVLWRRGAERPAQRRNPRPGP